MNATVTPAEAKVTATPTGGDTSKIYTTGTTGDGSFELDLPPGTYEVTGALAGKDPGGHVSSQDVTVDAGKATEVKLLSIYP